MDPHKLPVPLKLPQGATATRCTYRDAYNSSLAKVNAIHPKLLDTLKSGKTVNMELTETLIGKTEEFTPVLKQHNILQFVRGSGMVMRGFGVQYTCSFIPLGRFAETIADPNFRI